MPCRGLRVRKRAMFAALLLAAGAAATPARTVDQRVSLLEARQMLQSQTLWTLQAAMPPDAAKAMNDLDLHLAEDRERDEKLRQLEGTVATLEQRLAAVEVLLGDRSLSVENGPVRVAKPLMASTQIPAMVLKAKPQAKQARAKHEKRETNAAARASK